MEIKISAEREAQLRALAERRGIRIEDLIEEALDNALKPARFLDRLEQAAKHREQTKAESEPG